jgi:hypothetical protein
VTFAWAASNLTLAGAGAVSGQTLTSTLYATPASSNAPTSHNYWTGGAPVSGSPRTSRTNAITVYRSANP